jgi:transposase InsO family protein
VAPDDAALRRRLRKISEQRPRWGYRRAHGPLLTEEWSVDCQRVQRIWREALAIEVDRAINADATVRVLERLAAERGAPRQHPCRQRPGADRLGLREWCRLGSPGTAHIEPGSPWQKPLVESFHNTRGRHSSLNMLTPTEFEDLHQKESS